MGFGFRLFKVTAAAGAVGTKPKQLEVAGDAAQQHYGEHVDVLLTILEDWSTLTGAPILKPSIRLKIRQHRKALGEKGDPRIRFLSHEAISTREILFETAYGRVGRFPKALAVDVKGDADIGGLATGHPFRSLLLLPEEGEVGILAIEDVDGNSPARVIPNWISRASDWRSRKQTQIVKPANVRLVAKQVADLPKLRAMINGASDIGIRLTKKSVNYASKRKSTDLKVEYKVRTKVEREAISTWAEQFAGVADHNLQGNGVAEMAGVVDGSLKSIGFTDAVITLTDESGTKKVSASKLDEFFVYPIDSEDRPDDDAWMSAVKATVLALQGWLEVDVLEAD